MTRIQFKLVNYLNFLKILIQIKGKETKMLRIFNRKITYKLKTFESQINQNQTPHAQATHNESYTDYIHCLASAHVYYLDFDSLKTSNSKLTSCFTTTNQRTLPRKAHEQYSDEVDKLLSDHA